MFEDRLTEADYGRLVTALAIGFGTEAATSLTDVARLKPDAALEVMLVPCRWILDGALSLKRGSGRAANRRGDTGDDGSRFWGISGPVGQGEHDRVVSHDPQVVVTDQVGIDHQQRRPAGSERPSP